MSIATIEPYPSSRAATRIAVCGHGAHQRARAARLLSRAGFDVSDAGCRVEADELAPLVAIFGDGVVTARLGEIRTVAEARPGAHLLAVMPADSRPASLRRALLAGASGIVLDDVLEEALVVTVDAVLVGQLVVPGMLFRQIAPRPLSHREREVIDLVVLGHTNQQIAQQLYLAESTIKTHLSSAFRKLDARSRSEAVARLQDPEAGYGLGSVALHDLAFVPAGD